MGEEGVTGRASSAGVCGRAGDPVSRRQGPRSARPRGRCWIRRTRERRTQGSSAWEGRGACGPGRGPRKPGGPGPAPRSFLGPQHAARARRSPAGLRRASAQCRLLAEASVCPEPPRADPRLRVRAGGSLLEAFGSARASQLPKRGPRRAWRGRPLPPAWLPSAPEPVPSRPQAPHEGPRPGRRVRSKSFPRASGASGASACRSTQRCCGGPSHAPLGGRSLCPARRCAETQRGRAPGPGCGVRGPRRCDPPTPSSSLLIPGATPRCLLFPPPPE